MSTLLPYIFLGLSSGSVYALAGVGLVLTYKTSGIFNFAHGALGTVAAYVFYTLSVQHDVPWPIAAGVSVCVLGPALGLGFEWFGRGLARTSMVWRIAATVGILVSIEGLFSLIYGTNSRPFPSFLPDSTFNVFGANVTWEQLIVAATAAVATFGLWLFFRLTRMGTAMRAVVDDPDNLAITGTNPVTVRRYAWMIGCSFATLSGLLLAPSVSLDPAVLTLLIVQAFGAAALGGFSSLPLTYAGGLGIGVVASVLSKYSGGVGSVIGGIPASLPFIVLFVVLLFAPKARLNVKEVSLLRRPLTWQAPNRAQVTFGICILAFLALVPTFAGFEIGQWSIMLTYAILFISLGLLVRSSGQVSLCQLSFAAIGAVAFSKFLGAGVPWFLALLLAGLFTVPIGVLLAIPAIRRSGLYLALATFGFGLLLQNMLYQTSWMFNADGSGVQISTPGISWLSSPKGYYYLVLVMTAACGLLAVAVIRGRLGRLMRGIADSPLALSSQGASVNITLVLIFGVSAFMAAISGALAGGVLGDVTGLNFDPFNSLVYVATLMIAVGGAPWYALLAAVPLALGPVYITASGTLNYLVVTFGASVVIVALRGQMRWGWAERAIDRLFGNANAKTLRRSNRSTKRMPKPTTRENIDVSPMKLVANNIVVRYGGLVAVSDCSFEATSGLITGLIGPNGAGKTSALNVCSGLVRARSGQVCLDGRDIGGLSLAARARLGIGRSFQQIELFETLTVRENLVLGSEGCIAGRSVIRQAVTMPAQRRTIEDRVAEAADRTSLTQLLDVQVGALSTGQRRLVEFGRCLAGSYRMILLDEPSSGLDHMETAAFGRILKAAVRDRNLGVLLVEHDISLVMTVCDVIYVMDFGSILFRGSPAEVRASEAVRTAYLGESSSDSSFSNALEYEQGYGVK